MRLHPITLLQLTQCAQKPDTAGDSIAFLTPSVSPAKMALNDIALLELPPADPATKYLPIPHAPRARNRRLGPPQVAALIDILKMYKEDLIRVILEFGRGNGAREVGNLGE